jgi:hypothetical protein
MRSTPRFAMAIAVSALCFATFGFAQRPADDVAAAQLSGNVAGYADKAPVSLDAAQASTQLAPINNNTILEFPANAISSRAGLENSTGSTNGASGSHGSLPKPGATRNDRGDGDNRPNLPTIDGLDSIATFSSAFINQAGPRLGAFFPFTMVGNHPALGGTTVIPTQITTVNLRLLNPDGTLNVEVPFNFGDVMADSPNFASTNYRSGKHIQYADAVHRAQFFNVMGEDWHTVLGKATVVNNVTFTIPRFVNVRFADGTVRAVQAYRVGTAADGNHFVLMLDLLFNALYQNQVINDINGGNFTTDAISHMWFPNTFLFSIDNQGNPLPGFVLGFHTFFFDPGSVPQPRWVTLFASFISPGLFGAGFQDVTALSHEISEIFGNPFVNNTTASWQFPGVPPTAKICQANLEEGDPIEVLPVASVPITLRDGKHTFTYHPQIIPLLQWFEMGQSSNAIDGAFSFPDETTLPHSALPCPQ